MASPGDENRILIELEQRLFHEDPVFARRTAAMQRRMRRREIIPYRSLCLLLAAATIVTVLMIVATMRHHDGTPAHITPSQQVTADQRPLPVVEPR